jgi:mono/diheme cytochrome c family protein
MIDLFSTVLANSTVKSFGAVMAVIALIAFVAFVAANVRQGRPEIDSEIELAPNRQEPVSDEEIEGPRLARALSSAWLLLIVIAVGLPLYWLNEPSRQEGEVAMYDQTFINRGAALFAPTAEGGYNCAGCHGDKGVGGITPQFTLNDAAGKFKAGVYWFAPALNTVLLRFSKDEVKDILTYGRPGTPMPAWGTAGGGPMTDQQLDDLLAYLQSIQITSKDAQKEVEVSLRKALGLAKDAPIDYTNPATGKALFNLGLGDDPAAGDHSGAYSCARCHTKGASIQKGPEVPAGVDLSDFKGFPDGSGAFGYSLRYPIVPRQFLTPRALADFITTGSTNQVLYGQRGVGTGRMPGFGDDPNTVVDQHDGMFTDEMIDAVAVYEANLHLDGKANDLPNGPETHSFTYDEATTTSTSSTTSTTTKG